MGLHAYRTVAVLPLLAALLAACSSLSGLSGGSTDAGRTQDTGTTNGSTDGGCADPTCGCMASCGAKCVETATDPSNCGGCGKTCTNGICQSGQCTCVGGDTVCAGGCVDVTTDAKNCGGCGKACLPGAVCSQSTCTCPDGDVVCDAACVDPQTNPDHCGGCDTACAPGQACAGGSCACPAGKALCSDTCVDEKSDANNCGGCGLACSVPCVDGECILTLATGQGQPAGIAVDATSVYWTSYTLDTVVKVGLTGGVVTTLASGQDYPTSMATSPLNVYWINNDFPGSVVSVPLGGRAPNTLVAVDGTGGGGGTAIPNSVALDSTSFYWSAEKFITMEPLAGGAPTTIASGLDVPAQLSVAGGLITWADLDGNIVVMPSGGGSMVTIGTGQYGVAATAMNATDVYWAAGRTAGNSTIVKAPVGGGTVTTLANQYGAGGLVIDATHLYLVNDNPNGSIVRMGLDGSNLATLVTAQDGASVIAIDASSVYWGRTDGTILKATPR